MSFPHTLVKNTARKTALVCGALFCIALACAGASAEKIKGLKAQGYVDDFAGVLSAPTRAKLNELCAEVDHKAGAQIAVVTVHSLEGESAERYTFDLASQWGVGPKQSSRGVMILVAPDEHKYYTAVGYGLEGILPDGKVGGFGREAVPLLKAQNYDMALLLITQRVAAVIAADKGITLDALQGISAPQSQPGEGGQNSSGNSSGAIVGIFIVVVVLFGVFSVLFRRGGPTGTGRRGTGGLPWWAWMILGNMMSGGGGRSSGSWGGGGFGGGGGGGGGGFGGFGGGSFGGGGAGGSW